MDAFVGDLRHTSMAILACMSSTLISTVSAACTDPCSVLVFGAALLVHGAKGFEADSCISDC